MILDSMAWFGAGELEQAGISFVKDTGLILRAKKGSDKFGWGEKEDIIMSHQQSSNSRLWGVPRAWPEVVRYEREHKEHGNICEFSIVHKAYRYIGPELRDDQKECVQQAYDHLTVRDGWQQYFPGGIIQAPAGTGKTILALNLIAKLGQKALIIVHKEILMKQWKEQIEKCISVNGQVPNVGIIQADRCQSVWGDICIGMVQSLSRPNSDYEKAYKNFGIVIVDEVHRLGAAEWHKAIKHFPAKYRVGLTATPRRADGFADVFKWHIGPVMAKLDSARMEPKVIFRSHNSKLNQKKYTWKKKVNLGKLTTKLAEDQQRNTRIGSLALHAIEKGRMPLILSDRVSQVKWVKNYLIGAGKTPLVFHGTAEKVLATMDIENYDAVVGTYQMIKEGLDLPRLDTLIFATPKVDVEQAVGRILRDHPDKKEPLVVDMIDENLPVLVGFAEGRRNRYIEAYGKDCVIEVKEKGLDFSVKQTSDVITVGDDVKNEFGTILGKILSVEMDDETVVVNLQGNPDYAGGYMCAKYPMGEVRKI